MTKFLADKLAAALSVDDWEFIRDVMREYFSRNRPRQPTAGWLNNERTIMDFLNLKAYKGKNP